MNYLGHEIPASVVEGAKAFVRSKAWLTERSLAYQIESAWPADLPLSLEAAARVRNYVANHIINAMLAARELERDKPYRGSPAYYVRTPGVRGQGDSFRRPRTPTRYRKYAR